MQAMSNKAKTILFWSAKGGCGKSSLTLLTAKRLETLGKKVLVLDGDPQRTLTYSLLKEDGSKNLFDFLSDDRELKDCILKISPGIDLIPGSLKLLKMQNNCRQNAIATGLEPILSEYDFILQDSAPTYNSLILSQVQSADILILPSLISMADLQEVAFTINEANLTKPSIEKKILVNRAQYTDKLTADEKEYFSLFENQFPDSFLASRIPNSPQVRRIADRGESILSKQNTKLRVSLDGFLNEAGLVKVA